MPDQHEQRLVREVKEHRQVERREKEGRRRARIQSGKETRQQVSRSFSGRHRVMKEGSRGGNMEWRGGRKPVQGGGCAKVWLFIYQ